MKPSEELMLLLELNGFDVLKFKLKKQLEFEKTGNMDLYRHKKLQNLIISHYSYEEDSDYLHRNPLTYRPSWGSEIQSIDQFYVKHPDLEGDITLQEFLLIDKFDEINRESILYDILDSWVEEYREASITQMENLRQMIQLLPKKNRKYKKPSRIFFLFSILFALGLMFLFKSPEALSPSFFSFLGNFIDDYVELLYEYWWYSLLGNVAIYMFVIFAVLNSFFRRYMKDIRSEKSKHAQKTFDKWDQDMKDVRLKQAGILEDYVDVVVKHPTKSTLDIAKVIKPEILMDKFKAYVLMIERKYDVMTKYYKTFRLVLRLIYVFAVLVALIFLGVGFALSRGWI